MIITIFNYLSYVPIIYCERNVFERLVEILYLFFEFGFGLHNECFIFFIVLFCIIYIYIFIIFVISIFFYFWYMFFYYSSFYFNFDYFTIPIVQFFFKRSFIEKLTNYYGFDSKYWWNYENVSESHNVIGSSRRLFEFYINNKEEINNENNFNFYHTPSMFNMTIFDYFQYLSFTRIDIRFFIDVASQWSFMRHRYSNYIERCKSVEFYFFDNLFFIIKKYNNVVSAYNEFYFFFSNYIIRKNSSVFHLFTYIFRDFFGFRWFYHKFFFNPFNVTKIIQFSFSSDAYYSKFFSNTAFVEDVMYKQADHRPYKSFYKALRHDPLYDFIKYRSEIKWVKSKKFKGMMEPVIEGFHNFYWRLFVNYTEIENFYMIVLNNFGHNYFPAGGENVFPYSIGDVMIDEDWFEIWFEHNLEFTFRYFLRRYQYKYTMNSFFGWSKRWDYSYWLRETIQYYWFLKIPRLKLREIYHYRGKYSRAEFKNEHKAAMKYFWTRPEAESTIFYDTNVTGVPSYSWIETWSRFVNSSVSTFIYGTNYPNYSSSYYNYRRNSYMGDHLLDLRNSNTKTTIHKWKYHYYWLLSEDRNTFLMARYRDYENSEKYTFEEMFTQHTPVFTYEDYLEIDIPGYLSNLSDSERKKKGLPILKEELEGKSASERQVDMLMERNIFRMQPDPRNFRFKYWDMLHPYEDPKKRVVRIQEWGPYVNYRNIDYDSHVFSYWSYIRMYIYNFIIDFNSFFFEFIYMLFDINFEFIGVDFFLFKDVIGFNEFMDVFIEDIFNLNLDFNLFFSFFILFSIFFIYFVITSFILYIYVYVIKKIKDKKFKKLLNFFLNIIIYK